MTDSTEWRPIPDEVRDRLQPLFTVPIEAILSRPAGARSGLDAWTWVENGHEWSEVADQLERAVKADHA